MSSDKARNSAVPAVCGEIEDETETDICCGVTRGEHDVASVARAADLDPSERLYHPIDREQAERIAVRLLTRTLAHETPLLPLARARELTRRFLGCFSEASPKFYSNGTYDEPPTESEPGVLVSHFEPATSATFDTGILVVGDTVSGYLWVRDED